jgi:septum formation protein
MSNRPLRSPGALPSARPSPQLFLASASPRRRQLLRTAGIAFELHPVPVDEDALSAAYDGPLELLGAYLARAKAQAAWSSLRKNGREGLVLAADTTVLLDDRSLAKPTDAREANQMLRTLRGRQHVVATGVALAGPADGQMVSATSTTRVLMREYSDDDIAAYIATGDPLDKAGAYSIQHPSFHPVASIAGCHLGVIGLPVCIVEALVNHAPLPPSRERFGRGACPWSSQCSPPLPGPEVVHRDEDGEDLEP